VNESLPGHKTIAGARFPRAYTGSKVSAVASGRPPGSGDGAVGDEQRPGLQQVAARMRADAVAARGPGRAVTRDFLGYDGA